MADPLPKILFAWELGDNLGHAAQIARVASHLEAQADLTLAVQNVAVMRQMAPDLKSALLQAPFAPQRPIQRPEDAGRSYSDVMRICGWESADRLSALIEAWRSLFRLVQPDVIVSQAAPTALLAARGLGRKTAMFGAGYDCPPRCAPMPAFLHWTPDASDGLAEREAIVVQTANAALARHAAPQLDRFSDVLEVDAYMVTTTATLDHYAPRDQFEPDHDSYVGPISVVDQGETRNWRADVQHRIFAYLRPKSPHFEAAVRALSQLDPKSCHVILAAPGISEELQTRLKATAVDALGTAVRLDALLDDCTLVMSHCSNGTSAAAVQAGVPQIGLPNHPEQVMRARAIGAAGLGLALAGQYGAKEVLHTIKTVLSSDTIREKAKAVAGPHRQDGTMLGDKTVADRIWGLAENPVPAP